ncbi:MAG: type II toxin-antitoxin system VapB family antitoxin, partial [Thermoleophilia bacterium]|nr:type II toxin-antitoxin system VapB family antitoxin [Thermoleophilia bacterium]
ASLRSDRHEVERLIGMSVERLIGFSGIRTAMTGESKTQAIRAALRERRDRLALRVDPEERRAHLLRFLEREVWSKMPADQLGRPHDASLDDRILGYGPDGV